MATKKSATTVKKLYVLVDEGDPIEIGTLEELAKRIDDWYDGYDGGGVNLSDTKIYELGTEKKFTYNPPAPGAIKLK